MKKSLLALAVLGVFAGAASAQSSVTIYGFIDQSLTKSYASEDKQVADGGFYGGGSRLGFRGVEDLGGGYKATFGLEHRLFADTGAQAAALFWQGYSTVGLVTPFGAVQLGRQYTPAFLMIQNQIDPFGGETVAQGREVGMRFGRVAPGGATGSAVYKTRVADSIRYDLSVSGFNLGVSIAEGNANNGGGVTGADDKPFSIAANYAAGPFWVGIGYENPADEDDKGWNIGGRYNFGFMTAAVGFSKGTTAAGGDAKGWLIGATVPYGAFDFKAVYAMNDVEVAGQGERTKKAGIGVHYNLSKRTKIYADAAKIGGDATAPLVNSTGYDLGLKHSF